MVLISQIKHTENFMHTGYPKLIIEESTPKSKSIITKGVEEHHPLRTLLRILAKTNEDTGQFESTQKILKVTPLAG